MFTCFNHNNFAGNVINLTSLSTDSSLPCHVSNGLDIFANKPAELSDVSALIGCNSASSNAFTTNLGKHGAPKGSIPASIVFPPTKKSTCNPELQPSKKSPCFDLSEAHPSLKPQAKPVFQT